MTPQVLWMLKSIFSCYTVVAMRFSPKLIIGLGNPDKKYENAYHNAGFLFIEFLKESQQVSSFKFQVLSSEEYMNESGKYAAKMMKKIGAKPEELLIAHDDSDLEIGAYKIQFGRGAAGHHGVESVQQHLKTNNFWRLRIGIRPKQANPPSLKLRRAKAEEFVLKKISPADDKLLEKVFETIQGKLK
jgi:PTH1 family peptidyl-tRNA hydrolase